MFMMHETEAPVHVRAECVQTAAQASQNLDKLNKEEAEILSSIRDALTRRANSDAVNLFLKLKVTRRTKVAIKQTLHTATVLISLLDQREANKSVMEGHRRMVQAAHGTKMLGRLSAEDKKLEGEEEGMLDFAEDARDIVEEVTERDSALVFEHEGASLAAMLGLENPDASVDDIMRAIGAENGPADEEAKVSDQKKKKKKGSQQDGGGNGGDKVSGQTEEVEIPEKDKAAEEVSLPNVPPRPREQRKQQQPKEEALVVS